MKPQSHFHLPKSVKQFTAALPTREQRIAFKNAMISAYKSYYRAKLMKVKPLESKPD
jgi:hypothetical protein